MERDPLIESIRSRLGVPLQEVAKRAGIGQAHLVDIRNGRRSLTLRTAHKLDALIGTNEATQAVVERAKAG